MTIVLSSMPHLQPKVALALDRANEAPVATDLRDELATEADDALGLRPRRLTGVAAAGGSCLGFLPRLEGVRALLATATATATAES